MSLHKECFTGIQPSLFFHNTFNLRNGLCANLALTDGLKSLEMETRRLKLHSKPMK